MNDRCKDFRCTHEGEEHLPFLRPNVVPVEEPNTIRASGAIMGSSETAATKLLERSREMRREYVLFTRRSPLQQYNSRKGADAFSDERMRKPTTQARPQISEKLSRLLVCLQELASKSLEKNPIFHD